MRGLSVGITNRPDLLKRFIEEDQKRIQWERIFIHVSCMNKASQVTVSSLLLPITGCRQFVILYLLKKKNLFKI